MNFEEDDRLTIRGVDYLVLKQYNGSVTLIPVAALQDENAVDQVKNIEISKLKRLNPQSALKIWDAPMNGWGPVWTYLPWTGVVILYGLYISMHWTYMG